MDKEVERVLTLAFMAALVMAALGALWKITTSGKLGHVLSAAVAKHVPGPRLAVLEHRALVFLSIAGVVALLLTAAVVVIRQIAILRTLKTRETWAVLAPPHFDPSTDSVGIFTQALQGLQLRDFRSWWIRPACAFRVRFTVGNDGRPLYLWEIPRRFKPSLDTALKAYPGVELEPAAEYLPAPPLNSAGKHATQVYRLELRPGRSDVYPFRPLPKDSDPKALIAGTLANVNVAAGERLSLVTDFLLVRPKDSPETREELSEEAQQQEEGEPMLDLDFDWLGMGSSRNGSRNGKAHRTRPVHVVAQRMERQALWEKMGRVDPFFHLQVLICAESPIPRRSQQLLEKTWTALEQWTGQNYFRSVGRPFFGIGMQLTGSNSPARRAWFDWRMTSGRFALPKPWHRQLAKLPRWLVRSRPGGIVAGHEFAGLLYPFSKYTKVAVLRKERTDIAPPPAVRSEGLIICEHNGQPVALTPADTRYHGFYVAPTGRGKSTELEQHVLDSAKLDHAVVFIDIAGDSVRHLLERIPEKYADRIQLIDPSRRDRSVGLNVLQVAGESSQNLVADQVLAIFRRLFPQYWKDRSDDVMRNAVLTLMQQPGAALTDVPALLTDKAFRERCTRKLNDPIGLEPFWKQWEEMTDSARADRAGPVLSRLRSILLRPEVRDILGQSKSTIDLSDTLDKKRILLVNLAEGTLGEDTSRLLGSLLVIQLWQATLRRASRPEGERPDATIIIDEFPNFIHLPSLFAKVLSQSRKEHVGWILALQYMDQLVDPLLRSAVLENCHTQMGWRPTSEENAKSLAPILQMAPHDLLSLDAHQVAVRLCVDGTTQPVFTGRTFDLPPSLGEEHAEKLAQAALKEYGRPCEDVEEEILKRLRIPSFTGSSEEQQSLA